MKSNLTSTVNTGEIAHFLLLTVFAILFFSRCTFPNVIVIEDPLTPEEHINLGVAYENRGDLDNAIEQYNLASEELPLAYIYLGTAHFRKNEMDKS